MVSSNGLRRGKRTSNSLLLSDARGCSSAVNRAESELGTRSGRLSSFEFSFLDSWVPCKRPTHKAPQSLRYGQGRTPQRAMARRRLWPCILLSFCLVEHTRRQRVLARKGADGGGDPSSMMGLCWRLGGVHKAHDLEIPGRLLGTGCNISSRPRSIYGAKEWGGQDLKQSRTHADDSQYGQSREASVCASRQGCCGAQQPTGQNGCKGDAQGIIRKYKL